VGVKVTGEVANDPDQIHDFSALGLDFDLDVERPAESKKVETKQEVKPTEAKPTPAPASEEKKPEATPEVKPEPAKVEVKPEEKVEAKPPATQQAEQQKPASVDDVIKAMQDDHEKVMAQVLPKFALSAEQVKALEENATEEVPKLLASTYMRSVNTALRYMKEFVPGMIARTIHENNAIKETNESFFGKYKQIDRNNPEQIAAIKSYAAAFRSVNPQIAQDELFNLVATAVSAKFNLGAGTVQPNPNPNPNPAPTKAPGFVPAGPGVQVRTQPVDNGQYAGLGEDFE
jgi:hypothetical protein